MVVVDTREKKWAHIREYFEQNNIPYVVQKLDVADYQIEGNENFVIDRKQNLDECCSNLCTDDSGRFWREVRLSKERGIKMIVLVEHSRNYRSIKDVANWKSKYTKVTGKQLMEEMYRVHIAYGVEWFFCTKKETGKRIMEILSNE
jgi:ERCC4-type nuclease